MRTPKWRWHGNALYGYILTSKETSTMYTPNLFGGIGIGLYQLPFILTALLHVDLLNVAYLTAYAFIRS